MSVKDLYEAKSGEQLVFALRRHPITFVKNVLGFLALAVVPAVAFWVYFGGVPHIANPYLAAAGVLLAGTYYLGIWLFFFSQFADYYLDISLVTTERIIDIDQEGLFGRVVSEMNLSKIQDVKSEVKGIVATVFNYGLVEVESAGAEENFHFSQCPNPHHVRQRILELAAQEREKEGKQMVSDALTQEK